VAGNKTIAARYSKKDTNFSERRLNINWYTVIFNQIFFPLNSTARFFRIGPQKRRANYSTSTQCRHIQQARSEANNFFLRTVCAVLFLRTVCAVGKTFQNNFGNVNLHQRTKKKIDQNLKIMGGGPPAVCAFPRPVGAIQTHLCASRPVGAIQTHLSRPSYFVSLTDEELPRPSIVTELINQSLLRIQGPQQ
jgi:hypothetical protein